MTTAVSTAVSTVRVILDNAPKGPTPLISAIEALGVEVLRGVWQPDEALLARTDACLVSFYDCLKRPLEVWRLKRALARHAIPLVVWNRDAPGYMNKARWRLALLERAKLIDLYASHALADGRRFAHTQLLLQNAAQTDAHNLAGLRLADLDDPTRYRYDVGFFGTLDGETYKEYRARAQFFLALAQRLAGLGITHTFIDTRQTPLSPAEQRDLIQRTRINLNFGAGCEYGYALGHGLPERCFGVPACGGFLLSDRRLHAAEAFEAGSEWSEFEGLDQALARIRHFLDRFGEARAVAAKAYARVMRAHTYRHRAGEILAAIDAWRAAHPRVA
ncbi:MAG: glycosyltransferase family 1 protein [Betaproteobacteria bacterium]|nr:glycosyltransferase family 1 protein [Betaproteobacteria bacterium]